MGRGVEVEPRLPRAAYIFFITFALRDINLLWNQHYNNLNTSLHFKEHVKNSPISVLSVVLSINLPERQLIKDWWRPWRGRHRTSRGRWHLEGLIPGSQRDGSKHPTEITSTVRSVASSYFILTLFCIFRKTMWNLCLRVSLIWVLT